MPDDINAAADASPLRTLDPNAEREMIARIDDAKREGNTLGGICEVVCRRTAGRASARTCRGTGSSMAASAAAIMSIPAVKGVEIGLGFEAARAPGAEVHDEIVPAR